MNVDTPYPVGYLPTPVTGSLAVGDARPFAFRVLGPDGNPATEDTTSHDKGPAP
ncbi:hypothetical protein [Dactylosporangium darangshiense]|uniref:Uncharacterized protein n=1 Tax=Dactylosporangium darangshiense TaxID=579108 RepID=A0ABP8DQ01_9ACTN